ncbi:NAD(P)/FAD-dependent oxidoreductase [Roseomonas xinghualingensis]|uniref:NAD(P)/FAD-dependent oxidoreductase n=1 Tax=Roseomonas xinghualingensis TaxID=2986475 RepID=UPI0021F1EE24|nr:NAD(P)/FAD-dependent oxidoreductase [Roseomonas sp. SXEYE001]MCV4206166.1 NAD(P)/FAD-dependent oxidoreductase [Roseomonas sp. SXEYE001]
MAEHTGPGQVRPSRRALLARIGAVAGGAAMYQVMSALGVAAESAYASPIKLEGDPRGATVVILGAGLAGMVAAMELRKAGYRVQVLEYSDRPGGRCWSLRGGDRYTELGGETQTVSFDQDLYFNPGPWRIPYNHHAVLDYCKRLGVALEPFVQVNYNTLLHGRNAFGGRPQRYREINADYQGGIAELLAKATRQGKLDEMVSGQDQEILLESLRAWGALNADMTYAKSLLTSDRRGFARDPGGGLAARPVPSEPVALKDVLSSRLWSFLVAGSLYEFQTTMFQPVGGMDMIAKAMAREVDGLIRYNAKVTAIRQDDRGVMVTVQDAQRGDAPQEQVRADWCVCTIPLSVLSQIEMNVGGPMAAAIAAVPYAASAKVGLQFKRRFWEQDEHIYGGISYTDLPIRMISYPSASYGAAGKGVLLGAYTFGPYAYEFTALPAAERVRRAVEWGATLHPQYRDEFDGGVSVGWHRVPGALGCNGMWTDAKRAEHYDNLCALDGRIVLAGEHASYIPAWQEGTILSSLNAISRLHHRVVTA